MSAPTTPHIAAQRRLNRDTDSCIVSYRRESDGRYASVQGFGRTLRLAVADADSGLPPGVWTRESVSTPSSVYSDVCALRSLDLRSGAHVLQAFEGKTVER